MCYGVIRVSQHDPELLHAAASDDIAGCEGMPEQMGMHPRDSGLRFDVLEDLFYQIGGHLGAGSGAEQVRLVLLLGIIPEQTGQVFGHGDNPALVIFTVVYVDQPVLQVDVCFFELTDFLAAQSGIQHKVKDDFVSGAEYGINALYFLPGQRDLECCIGAEHLNLPEQILVGMAFFVQPGAEYFDASQVTVDGHVPAAGILKLNDIRTYMFLRKIRKLCRCMLLETGKMFLVIFYGPCAAVRKLLEEKIVNRIL